MCYIRDSKLGQDARGRASRGVSSRGGGVRGAGVLCVSGCGVGLRGWLRGLYLGGLRDLQLVVWKISL